MADISELNLPEDSIPEISWDAPEAGSFPPSISPGVYEILFHLPEQASDQFDKVEIKPPTEAAGVYLQVNHEAEILRDSQGNSIPATSSGNQPRLNFQRVSAYKHPKMTNSGLGELLRSLNLRVEGPLTPARVAEVLRGADGRQTYRGEVGWRRYCKPCDQTISTHPRKKKGDAAWPRNGNGEYEASPACPKCGAKAYGNAEVVRYLLPAKS